MKTKSQKYQQAWRAAHPNYHREWRASHPEYKKAKRVYDRAWRKANPARCDKAKREVRTVRWRKAHPEQVREARRVRDHRRASREHGNGGSWTTEQWLALKAKYDNKCLCCGLGEKALANRGRQLVPDHVIPLAKNGRNSIENLQPLCHGPKGCNNIKHDKHIDCRLSVRAREKNFPEKWGYRNPQRNACGGTKCPIKN